MAGHFFALISRMRNIRRWGLMANTFEENIQEHSHMVAVLAHALAMIRRDVFLKEADPEHAAAVALFHDASEILTGDLPTPVKYFNPEIRKAYAQIETVSLEKLLKMLPGELAPGYRSLLFSHQHDDPANELVHAADKLAAYIKCVEELRAGNGEFKKAAQQLKKTLDENPLEEVGYFMTHFIPSFSLTLDEQE